MIFIFYLYLHSTIYTLYLQEINFESFVNFFIQKETSKKKSLQFYSSSLSLLSLKNAFNNYFALSLKDKKVKEMLAD